MDMKKALDGRFFHVGGGEWGVGNGRVRAAARLLFLRIPNPVNQYSTRLRNVPGIAANWAFSAFAWAASALTSITT